MRKLYSLFISLIAALTSFAQITAPVSLLSGTYSQDFNTLAITGTSSVTPAGWGFTEVGTSALNDGKYTGNNGSSGSGDTYSFGAASSTERAFGGVLSGTLTPTVGAAFTNNSGNTITSITINYTGEQWRLGATGRTDRLDFQYSLSATSLATGTWIDVDALDFNAPNATGVVGAFDGNATSNRAAVAFTITGLNLINGANIYIRWNDFNASGADDGLGIDDFSLSFTTNSGDVTPPSVLSVSPANNATGIAQQGATATITFDENIQKGTGNISVKKTSDNSIVQTIDVTASTVTVSGTAASFIIPNLLANTSYYITIDPGAIKDASNNSFVGITNATTWAFTTGNALFIYDFSSCISSLSDAFTQQSVIGAEVWGCSTFGKTGNGVEMNGYNGGNQNNEDWLVSPALDLTGTTYPLLSFYSRSKFAGDALKLYVATSYTGNVTTTTWTEINGFFPATNSDVWTLSDNIDLSAYKQSNIRLAFKYTSNTTTASRWTLDDISIVNSTAPAQAVFNASTTLLDFRQVNVGINSTAKSFNFSVFNLNSGLTLTAPTGFELSKDQASYTSSLTYTPLEAQNGITVYARLSPTAVNTTYNGYVQFSGTGFNRQAVFLKGNSYLAATTLNVVNWNIEWFGSTGLGPSDENLQQANAKKVMDYLDADVYGVAEIVDVTRFGNLIGSLNSPYSYVIGEYCSNGATAGACTSSQKLALAYKTSVLSNVTARPLLFSSATALANFASGRVPFLVTADVAKNGQSTSINFIVVHAKANTGTTSDQISAYNSRKAGNQELKDTLDNYFPNANIIFLGDFNDNLIGTIAPTTGADTVSSYQMIVADSTDANSYKSLTLPLSNFKLASTADNPGMIDHVIISNEMASRYVNFSASLYNDIDVLAGISNYSTTTSDHYPVMTRFQFGGTLPVKLVSFTAVKENTSVKLNWITSQEINTKEFVVEHSTDGLNFGFLGITPAKGNSTVAVFYQMADSHPAVGINYYRLKTIDFDGKYEYSKIVKLSFNKAFTVGLSPNPASDKITITLANSREPLSMQLVDMNGKVVKRAILTNSTTSFSTAGLSKGLYLVKVQSSNDTYTEKLIIE